MSALLFYGGSSKERPWPSIGTPVTISNMDIGHVLIAAVLILGILIIQKVVHQVIKSSETWPTPLWATRPL